MDGAWRGLLIGWLCKPKVTGWSVNCSVVAPVATINLRPTVRATGHQTSTPNKEATCVVTALPTVPRLSVKALPVASTFKRHASVNRLSLPRACVQRFGINTQVRHQANLQSLAFCLHLGSKRHTLLPKHWQLTQSSVAQVISQPCGFATTRHRNWLAVARLPLKLRPTSIKCLSHAEHIAYTKGLARQAGCHPGRVILRCVYQGVSIGAFQKLEPHVTHVVHHREDCLLATPKTVTEGTIANDNKDNTVALVDVIIGLRLDTQATIKAILPSKRVSHQPVLGPL
jgi:hypothetical protein